MMIQKRTRGLMALMKTCCVLSTLYLTAAQTPTQEPTRSAHMLRINTTGSDEHGMPEVIELEFSVEEERVALNLTINPHIRSKVPVYVGRDDGKIEKMDVNTLDNFAVYTDAQNSASILYRPQPDEDGEFSGTFRMGNADYMLEPAAASGTSHGRVRRDTSSSKYIVYVEEPSAVYDIYLNRREEQNLPSQFAEELMEYYQEPPAGGKQMYFVESFWVLDYGMYNKWYNLAHSRNSRERDIETINNIRYYFTHVANGVDMRYRSIDESDYGVTVKLTGFYIASTPSAARWSEVHRESDGRRQYVEAYRMLDDIIKWVDESQKASRLPRMDQVTMFSGYRLFNDYKRDGTRRTINGLADVQGVCSKFKVSVNTDNGLYAATQTSAHEMGHSLGAIHDGPNNNCESRDQYIMAISPGALTTSNFNNVFTFSHCSRDEIRQHLNYLRMQGKNCLMNPAENGDQVDIDRQLEKFPGQIFSPDDQCRYIHGPSAYYCGGQVADSGICHALVCYSPLSRKCGSTVEHRAANGTTCGNKKWCMFGKCVADEKAPVGRDYCMSGDSRGTLSDKTRCKDISLTTWKCYLDHMRKPCCASCLAARDESNPRCIYGDKVHWCHTIRRADCYNPTTRDKCCNKCAKLRSERYENCEYGDRASWCRTVKPSSCYSNSYLCCERCSKLKEDNERTGRYPKSCTYGDQASWCTDHRSRPWQCYISGRTCCGTCSDVATGIPGCEYGDKMGRCYGVDCTDSYYQRRCCATCSAYNGLTRPPPTTRRPPPTTTTTTTTPAPTTTTTTTRATTTAITGTDITPHQRCLMEGRDIVSWCIKPDFFHGICYKSAHICCVTCAMADRGTEYCRYGDKVSWCSTIPSGHCYDKTTENQCCETCPRHLNEARPDCRYGDKYAWCPRERNRCSDDDIRQKCCHTCADYQSTTTTTTTTTPRPTTTTTEEPGVSPDHSSSSISTTPSTTSTTTTTTTTPTPTTTRSSTTTSEVIRRVPLECPTGDDASWCSTIPSSYCYTTEKICCATCQEKIVSEDRSCRYGDRFTWCPNIDQSRCSETTIREDCCYLCKDFQSIASNPEPACQGDGEGCDGIEHRDCYQSSTRETCCQTCESQQSDIIGCTYGDHADWCSKDLASYECYKHAQICCRTCARYHTGVSGCEYGDRTPVCEGLDCNNPEIRDLCCETCANKKTQVAAITTTTTVAPIDEGCLGDTVSWCRTIKGRHCYSDNELCCQTCLKFYLGFRGCEYGDRVSWCKESIENPSDCEKTDIADNCCYTCALLGSPSTRENPEEWREGVLVGFLKEDISKIIAEEMDMLMFLSHQVNEFCLDNPAECCVRIYKTHDIKKTDLAIPEILVDEVEPQQRPEYRIVLPSDCHIAGGYPRHSENNNGEIITKYLVKLRPEALEPLCGGPQRVEAPGHRRKRDVNEGTRERPIYFNKFKLREMILENKDVIEAAMGVMISRVAFSGEIKSTSFKVVIGVAAGALIAFIVVSIALFITIKKLMRQRKRREKPSDEKELCQPASVLGFRPGKNKVRHWDQMSDSLSSISRSTLTSPVYVSNGKLSRPPYITAPEVFITEPSCGSDGTTDIDTRTLTSPNPPPPYDVTIPPLSGREVDWSRSDVRQGAIGRSPRPDV